MSTYREIVYMVLDQLKLSVEDSYFTEEHVIFLISNYRNFLLKQRYSDIKKQIPENNYQTICLDLVQISGMPSDYCDEDIYLRSKDKVPFLMQVGSPRVYPISDYYKGDISYVNRDRMRFTGYNKYLNNIIYASISPDNYLYLKSNNPQFLHLSKVKFTGIFQDTIQASNLECVPCEEDNISLSNCDILDKQFPIENALIPPLIELVVKELSISVYRPEDNENNSRDDLQDQLKTR